MNRPLDAAVIGLGRMGTILATLVRDRIPQLRVVSVADARPDLEQVVSEVAPGASVTDDVELAVGRAEVCLIASPTSLHADHVRHALSRGVHVFCEKPLTLDPTSDRDLGAAAAALGLRLQVGLYRRYAAAWIAAAEALQSGRIGIPVSVRSAFLDPSVPGPAFADPRVSGGLLVDNGVHELDVLLWMLGPVDRVEAFAGPDPTGELGQAGDLASAVAILRFESGVVGTAMLTRGLDAEETVLEVVGTRGRLRVRTSPSCRAEIATAGTGFVKLPGSASGDYWRDAVTSELQAFALADRRAPGAADSAAAVEVALRLRDAAGVHAA